MADAKPFSEEMKLCSRCGKHKPVNLFYAEKKASDGKRSDCKDCNWAKRNPEKKMLSQLQYRIKYKSRLNKKRLMFPNKHTCDKERYRTYYAVRKALIRGVLKKPDSCQSCGSTRKLYAHHNDYSKPLDVMWLCMICHGDRHCQHNITEAKMGATA